MAAMHEGLHAGTRERPHARSSQVSRARWLGRGVEAEARISPGRSINTKNQPGRPSGASCVGRRPRRLLGELEAVERDVGLELPAEDG